MRDVHLAALDLNLLPCLEALLRRRNVTQAAADVGLSQPAMSRALARLREVLGDTLLVRAPGGYALTPRAEALAAQLPETVRSIKAVFQDPDFDPAQVRRTVVFASSDTQTLLIAPPLMARLAAEAPGIDLRMTAYAPDTVAKLQSGDIDLAFAISGVPLPPGARSEIYAKDQLALVMREGHPLARRKWRIEDYARADHASVAIFGDAQSELDAQLAAAGVQRRIAFRSPHFMAALAVVARTDLVTTISRSFARCFADAYGLALKRPPLPEIDLEPTMVWSRVRDADPVLAWIRGMIREIAAELDAGTP